MCDSRETFTKRSRTGPQRTNELWLRRSGWRSACTCGTLSRRLGGVATVLDLNDNRDDTVC